jgi:hypothetical protein
MQDDRDIRTALGLQQQLRSIFELHSGGSEDPAVLLRVRKLCAVAMRQTQDSFCRTRLAEIENYADAFFSDRKHQRWARNQSTSGVPALRRRAFAGLDALDERVQYIAAAKQLEAKNRQALDVRTHSQAMP